MGNVVKLYTAGTDAYTTRWIENNRPRCLDDILEEKLPPKEAVISYRAPAAEENMIEQLALSLGMSKAQFVRDCVWKVIKESWPPQYTNYGSKIDDLAGCIVNTFTKLPT